MEERKEGAGRTSRIALVDNGSLRAESTVSLRAIAESLGEALGERVYPVSLLHSSKVDPDELGGVPADTWRRFLKRELAAGARRFVVLPLFFGPSSAIVDYLPKVFEEVAADSPGAELVVAGPLVSLEDPGDDAVARILAEAVERRIERAALREPPEVIVVDHGSPVAEVAACRDLVARQMARLLEGRVSRVIASSMERREGEEYAFNEPLLERALAELDTVASPGLALSLMFLSPGRHAGPGGDVEKIVAASAWTAAGRETLFCDLVGGNPRLVELLARRYKERVDAGSPR